MPQTLIPQNIIKQEIPLYREIEKLDSQTNICNLKISEMFGDTLQGEGINVGIPATFIRLQGCTLQCTWCDTLDVWKNGNSYSAQQVFILLEKTGLVEKLRRGQHLILTGGSPLKQQDELITFIRLFITKYGFKPYVEIENECVLEPDVELIELIDCWNNSPKLENSGMKERVRYKPEIIKKVSNFGNSWFKFVISSESDWKEISEMFIHENLIKKNQIILMPEGQNQAELSRSREIVANICVREGVRFSDRLHITIWDKKTGV